MTVEPDEGWQRPKGKHRFKIHVETSACTSESRSTNKFINNSEEIIESNSSEEREKIYLRTLFDASIPTFEQEEEWKKLLGYIKRFNPDWLICLGIGELKGKTKSENRKQLKTFLSWFPSRPHYLWDPILTDSEKAFLKASYKELIIQEELPYLRLHETQRKIPLKILLFMPHCPWFLYDKVLGKYAKPDYHLSFIGNDISKAPIDKLKTFVRIEDFVKNDLENQKIIEVLKTSLEDSVFMCNLEQFNNECN